MTTVACITAFCCQVDDPRPAPPTPPHALWWPRAVVPLGILPALTGGGNRAFSRWRTRASRAWWPRLPERPRRLRLCSPQPDWPQTCLAPPTGRGVLDTDGLEVRHPGRAGQRPPPRGRQGRSPHRGMVGGQRCRVLPPWGWGVAWAWATATVAAHPWQGRRRPWAARLRIWSATACQAPAGDPAQRTRGPRGAGPDRRRVATGCARWTLSRHCTQVRPRGWASCHARLACTMAACKVLGQWHGCQPTRYGVVPLSMAELSW